MGQALAGAFILALGARNDVAAGKPAVEVDVAAAFGAERVGGGLRGFAADRAGPARDTGFAVLVAAGSGLTDPAAPTSAAA